MRTTIDLPEDLHGLAVELARSSSRTLSATVAALLRAALDETGSATVRTDPVTGLRTLSGGRPLHAEDVRALDDEE